MKQKLLLSFASFLLMYANALFAQSPTEAAPTPGHDAANVLSVYSDAYTAVSDVDLTQSWGEDITSFANFGGDNYMKLTELGDSRMKPIYIGTLDATGMEYLHFDIWPEIDIYWMRIQFQNWDDGSDDYDVSTTLSANTWNGVDIPLSVLNNVPITAINVFTFFGPDDKPTIYVDNMYFYTDVSSVIFTPDSEKENLVTLYPLNDAVRVESKEGIARIEIMTVSGQLINQIDAAGNNCVIETAGLAKGTYLLRVKTATGKDNILKYIK